MQSVCSEKQQGKGPERNPLVAIRKQNGKWFVISQEGEKLCEEWISVFNLLLLAVEQSSDGLP